MADIVARQVVREYAPGRGLLGLDLEVPPGRCHALLGRNGSGKTTLVRLLARLERVQRGALTVLGCDVAGGAREHLARCGILTDAAAHYEALSGWDNAYFVARAYGLAPADCHRRIDQLLALADLSDRAGDAVATYSYGMRRKLAIVQALAHQPRVLIMDEPSAGIDAHFVARLTGLIRSRAADGRTTVLCGNDPEFAAAVADRVSFIERGRIVADAAPDELVAELASGSEVRVELAAPVPLGEPRMAGLKGFRQSGLHVTAVVNDSPERLAELVGLIAAAGGQVRSLDVRRPTLRDAFLTATGEVIDG